MSDFVGLLIAGGLEAADATQPARWNSLEVAKLVVSSATPIVIFVLGYGKVRFAEKVVSPNRATIDFSGFAPLLDRLAAVIADYQNAPPWAP